MAPESRFLLLPREVRDLIYAAYFSAPGGYASDFSSGKLRRADGEPVHLSLRYACRQIAHETNGLALQLNSVTFTTLSEDESLRARAERFNHILCELYKGHYLLLSNLGPRPSPLVNEERLEEAIRQYPEVEKLVELYMHMGRADAFWTASYLNSDYPPLEAGLKSFKQSCGQIPSTFWEGVRFVFRHAVDMPSAIQKEQRSKFFQHPERIARSVSSCPDPWMIPTEDELNAMVQGVATRPAGSLKTRYFTVKDDYYGRSRFSAAAAAIHFLRCSHPDTRRHLRKLVVNEDRKSVAFPECHAKGFVPYLEENPRLQIERVASLWQCVFQKDKLGSLLATEFDRHLNILVDKESKLPVDYITYNVAEWMAEASTLQAFNGTFRLVLDGGPVPEHTARIFQDVVQRDAAWQAAFDRSFDWEGMDIKDIIALRQRNRSFNFEGFPEWVERIGKPDSVVQCNFDPGGPVDVQAIVDEHRDWSLRDWWNLWGRPGQTVDTCPPLAPWVQLIHDNVMPEWFELEDPSDSEDSLSS